MAHDTLLTYLDSNKEFKIHTNDSNFQLGAVIIQRGKKTAFYGSKLINDQKRYEVTEKEMIIFVETLKQFRSISLGQILRIYPDHKNLTSKCFNADRVLRWRLILGDCGQDI